MPANTVTFKSLDGKTLSLPLDLLIERRALLASEVNGEDITGVMGAANQLWIPGLPARYFMRDIVEIRFSEEERPPVLDEFEDDGHDFTNRPNVGMKAAYVGHVGVPLVFEGWANDFDRSIVAVQLSFDEGVSWHTFETSEADAERLVQWRFEWLPEAPGSYRCKARAVNERGDVSPVPAVHSFEILV